MFAAACSLCLLMSLAQAPDDEDLPQRMDLDTPPGTVAERPLVEIQWRSETPSAAGVTVRKAAGPGTQPTKKGKTQAAVEPASAVAPATTQTTRHTHHAVVASGPGEPTQGQAPKPDAPPNAGALPAAPGSLTTIDPPALDEVPSRTDQPTTDDAPASDADTDQGDAEQDRDSPAPKQDSTPAETTTTASHPAAEEPPASPDGPAVQVPDSQDAPPTSKATPDGAAIAEDAPFAEDGPSIGPKPDPLSSPLATLRDNVRRILAMYSQRPVNARDNTPWEVFHWIVAYNVEAQIRANGPWGDTTNAVAWLCSNRPCAGQKLLNIERGRINSQYGVGLEGHDGQFLAILAQSRVPIDYPMHVGGRSFMVADLVDSEMADCKSGPDIELTFKLIALAHYLQTNATWRSDSGEVWSIPRLIREEIGKPIHGAPCGGTHRLMGLSYAVRVRERRGEPVDGEYQRAQVYVANYQRYTLGLQNPDGSFSTSWFVGREARPDIDRRLQTSGHILEWLVFSLPEDRLRDPQVIKAVEYLTGILGAEPQREWKIGPLGHTLRALTLYDRRVFKSLEGSPPPELTDQPSNGAAGVVLAPAPAGSQEQGGVPRQADSGAMPGPSRAPRKAFKR